MAYAESMRLSSFPAQPGLTLPRLEGTVPIFRGRLRKMGLSLYAGHATATAQPGLTLPEAEW
jgi:hypothetical protein